MAKVQIEEFLTPAEGDPGKELKKPKEQPPDSPNKLMARNRLGSLLGQIRTGDGRATRPTAKSVHGRHVVVVGGGNDEQMDETGIDGEFDGQIGGRKTQLGKRMRREKRVVFELRGKAFGLRDSGQSESVYALCRKWMSGKDDQPAMTTDQQDELEQEQQQLQYHQHHLSADGQSGERPQPFAFGTMGQGGGHHSLDLMATKDIYALPSPRSDAPPPLDFPRPQRSVRRAEESQQRTIAGGGAEPPQMDTLLDDHLQHWKKVKQSWHDYSRKREQRYADSLQLLRTVYGIAQQTQQV